jgi:hypothetical protein
MKQEGLTMASSDSTNKRSVWKDRRVMLSTLWVFMVLNYLYADIFGLSFDPAMKETVDMSAGAVLFFAVIMETSIVMVLLSRVLPERWNRRANIGAAIVHIALLAWSFTEGGVTLFYGFFATVEIATMLFVIGSAWSWRKQSATQRLAVEGAAAR